MIRGYYWVILWLLLLTGCEIAVKQPELHDFGLPPLTTTNVSRVNTPTIELDAPKWIWDNRIRYRFLYKSPTKVNFYTLDRWIASPPELFKQELISRSQALNQPLLVKFLNFEQQFESPKQAKAVIRLAVTVLSPENNKPLANKEFYYQRYTLSADAKGAVDAFSILVNQSIGDIDRWLIRVQEQHPVENRQNL